MDSRMTGNLPREMAAFGNLSCYGRKKREQGYGSSGRFKLKRRRARIRRRRSLVTASILERIHGYTELITGSSNLDLLGQKAIKFAS
jgi:hypothetical protein